MKNLLLKKWSFLLLLGLAICSCNKEAEVLIIDDLIEEEIIPEVTTESDEGEISFKMNSYLVEEETRGFAYKCNLPDNLGNPTNRYQYEISTKAVSELGPFFQFDEAGGFLIKAIITDGDYENPEFGTGSYYIDYEGELEITFSPEVYIDILEFNDEYIRGEFSGEFTYYISNTEFIELGEIGGSFILPIEECYK